MQPLDADAGRFSIIGGIPWVATGDLDAEGSIDLGIVVEDTSGSDDRATWFFGGQP